MKCVYIKYYLSRSFHSKSWLFGCRMIRMHLCEIQFGKHQGEEKYIS